jgi:hypothetical protein
LPKTLRETRCWPPGTEFRVEETPEGVLLRPLKPVPKPKSTLSEVAGCLRWTGKPTTVAQMRGAIARKIKSRYDSVDTNLVVRLLTHLVSRPAGAWFVSFDKALVRRAQRAGVVDVKAP